MMFLCRNIFMTSPKEIGIYTYKFVYCNSYDFSFNSWLVFVYFIFLDFPTNKNHRLTNQGIFFFFFN